MSDLFIKRIDDLFCLYRRRIYSYYKFDSYTAIDYEYYLVYQPLETSRIA